MFFTRVICVDISNANYYNNNVFAGFLHEPTAVNATLNSTVRWKCSARTEDIRALYWKVNGTSTTNLSLRFIPTGRSSDGITVVTLTVEQATVAYNNSRVQCILIPDGNSDSEEIIGRSVTLTIQGVIIMIIHDI